MTSMLLSQIWKLCYAEAMQKKLQDAFKLANKENECARQKQKMYYDRRVFGAAPQVGDRVLVKRHQFSGKHKLEDRWEEKVKVIVGQDNMDIPVYRVKAEDGTGKERILHRNNIYPVIWSVEDDENLRPTAKPECVKASSKTQKDEELKVSESGSDSSEDEYDEYDADLTVIVVGTADDKNTTEQEDIEMTHTEVERIYEDTNEFKEKSVSEGKESDEERTGENREVGILDETELQAGEDGKSDGRENKEAGDNKHVEHEEQIPVPNERPKRNRRPPDRYGDAVMYQQTVREHQWIEKSQYLLSLLSLFPEAGDKILDAVIHIVAGASNVF